MIQRIQTIWLFLAAASILALYKIPVYAAKLANQTIDNLSISESYLLFIIGTILVLLPLITIFLYQNRGRQKLLVTVSILITLAFVGFIWWEVDKQSTDAALGLVKGHYKPGAILPVVSFIFLVLAYIGISKDEKLVRSADRLR